MVTSSSSHPYMMTIQRTASKIVHDELVRTSCVDGVLVALPMVVCRHVLHVGIKHFVSAWDLGIRRSNLMLLAYHICAYNFLLVPWHGRHALQRLAVLVDNARHCTALRKFRLMLRVFGSLSLILLLLTDDTAKRRTVQVVLCLDLATSTADAL